MPDTYKELTAKADELEKQLKVIRQQASEAHLLELKAIPLAERLVYAASSRCPCGAGLAYDPTFEDKTSVFKGPFSGSWGCSKVLLGTADKAVQHIVGLPFASYDIKSEQQGVTTRNG
jgi:hypothetical protein